jgi:uncharacterized protein
MMKTGRMRPGRWLVGGVLLLSLVALMLRWLEGKLVYVPSRRMDWTPAVAGWPHEDVRLVAGDGVILHAWFIPPPSNSPVSDRAVLLLHGNGGNISHRAGTYRLLREAGLAVFAPDYRGYGQSLGRPGEEGTYLDAEAAWRWLLQKGFAPSRVVVMGESLGGGVAAELALRQPVGGLILQSTFTSIPDVGAELFPWIPRWLARIQYDTCRKLPRLRCPVLILHSRADTLIRFAHAERNFAAAREPKCLRELLGDHNDAFDTPEGQGRLLEALREFLQSSPAAAGPKR